jgi:hypothetical protein
VPRRSSGAACSSLFQGLHDPVEREAGGPSPVGTKTPSVALGSQVHVVIDRRSKAVQKSRQRRVAGALRSACRRHGSSPPRYKAAVLL